MSLKLYHNPVSTCSQKVRLVLAEKELDYEEHVIDWSIQEHLSDWYLAINPNGVVPALVHDGEPVIDSSVICEYLDEAFPDTPMAPNYARGRANMRAWMRYFEEVPTTAIRVPSFNLRFQQQLAALDAEVFAGMTAKMPLRKQFYREMGQEGFSEEKFDASIERLRGCIDRVATALDAGGPWLLGELYSIADVVLLPTIIRMVDLKLDHVWADRPVIQTWLNLAMHRPSFVKAFYEGTRVL